MSDWRTRLWDEERERLSHALFVAGDNESVVAATEVGLDAVAAGDRRSLRLAAVAAVARGAPAILVGDYPHELRTRLERDVPQLDILGLRLPETSPTLAHHLRNGNVDLQLRQELFFGYLEDTPAGERPRYWTISASKDRPGAGDAFPVHVLPPVLLRLVTEGAAAQDVDPAFFGVPLLAILAGAIGATRSVAVREGWIEPSTLWAGVVAKSGSGKSPPLDVLLEPIRERDGELHKKSELAAEEHRRLMADWKATKRRKGQAAEAPPADPPHYCVLVYDITTEALAVRLSQNPRGVILAVDELASWLAGFDAYRGGRGGDEPKWISFFGARSLRVDRKAGPPINLPKPHVSVCGGIQPGVLRRLVGRDKHESGFAARLLLATPETRPALWTDEAISTQTLADYRRVALGLLDLEPVSESGCLELTPGASNLLRDEVDRIAYAAHEAGDHLAAVLSKQKSIVPRIALVLALARAAERGEAVFLRSVDSEAVQSGIVLGRYFQAQARRIHADRRTDHIRALASRIAQLLATKGRDGATRTDISHYLGRNSSTEDIEAALQELGDEIEEVSGPAGAVGRPPERWRLVRPTENERTN